MIQPKGRRLPIEMLAGVLVAISLVIGFVGAERFQRLAETASIDEPIIHATSTPYQRIVLTRRGGNVSLFLNGNLQFSSLDEYRGACRRRASGSPIGVRRGCPGRVTGDGRRATGPPRGLLPRAGSFQRIRGVWASNLHLE
jgi:hypothetical protein